MKNKIQIKLPLVVALLLFIGAWSFVLGQVTITGELKKWHKVTLLFEGPETTESPATFRDYRLNVTFTNGDQKFVVPGHFAADGNAAHTGADHGKYWRVYFTPNKTGVWQYHVSFRVGKDVAMSLDSVSGKSFAPIDGITGSLSIAHSDKQATDFRAKGMLRYVGGHFQQFADDKSYWIAIGTGSPENLLGGSDFDNISVGENWIKDHIQDWKKGDPTWRDGKGKGVIGAVNYTLELGMNTLWLSLMNAYCDPAPTSTEVYPWPTKEVTTENLSTFDVSKLDQWELVMTHAENRGMALHILLGEEEAESIWEKADGLEVGGQNSFAGTRKLYYREVVSRFGYFNALDWNMGEEFGFGYFPERRTPQQLATVAVGGWPPICDSQKNLFTNYLTALDPYGHTLSFEGDPHDFLGSPMEYYKPWFGKRQFQKASIQGNLFEANHYSISLREASANAGTPWVIVFAEHHRPILKSDKMTEGSFPMFRQSVWGTFLGGGAGVEWFIQPDDYYLKSFRPYKEVFIESAYAKDFITQYIPFGEMKSANALLSKNAGYCFASKNVYYAMYLKNAQTNILDLSEAAGKFDVFWYDVRTGGDLQYGTIKQIEGGAKREMGKPPLKRSSDWAVLVRNQEAKPLGRSPQKNQSLEKNTITDIDGNVYRTIQIGDQWWMAENLRVTRYRNGEAIPNVTDHSEWDGLFSGAYCAYDNDEENGDMYGYLYNWHAVHDSRQIAPQGWHVPTDEDWKQLEMHLGMSRAEADEMGCRRTEVGRMLKVSGSEDWKNAGSEGDNKSGLTVLPAGFRDEVSGQFSDLKDNTAFWASDEYNSHRASCRYLKGQFPQLYRYHYPKDGGLSIRCVKD